MSFNQPEFRRDLCDRGIQKSLPSIAYKKAVHEGTLNPTSPFSRGLITGINSSSCARPF